MFFSLIFLVQEYVFGSSTERACNNSPELCNVSYDRATHLGAHNSPYLSDVSTGFSSFGNQLYNSTVQLDAGVRLLTAQVHVSSNPVTEARELHLCHTSCALFDAGTLAKWLWEIRVWLYQNPHEVATLVLVNFHFVSAQEIQAEYARTDLAQYSYVPPNITAAPAPSDEFYKTWPTLGEMIGKEERLVTFVNALIPDKDNAPYLLNEFDFIWENAYDVTNTSEFLCSPDRPSNTTSIAEERGSGKLFFMNHLLYWQQAFGIKVPDRRVIADTNSWDRPGGLGTHMRRCANEVGRAPTFVLVNFFNVGPAIDSIDAFNGVNNPVGRKYGSGRRRINGSAKEVPKLAIALVVVIAAILLVY
jgi:hypothetical protein